VKEVPVIMECPERPAEVVFQGRQLDVCVSHEVVRGEVQEFEWVDRQQVVLAVPFTADGRLVLVRQYRAATGGSTLEMPAGKVGDEKLGEGCPEALARELREEAGYEMSRAVYLGPLFTAPHFCDEIVLVFCTYGEIVSLPQPTPREQLTVELVPPADIGNLIRSGQLSDAKSLAALLLHQVMENQP
jgi:ADP-ribose pyrophosphatase